MASPPTSSVIIPTYKAAPFIRETLTAVFAQTRLPDEVIVADDCSPDDTVAVVEEIAKSAPVSVRVIRLETNSGGPSEPMNVGVRAAVGQVIVLNDHDDFMEPGRIAHHSSAYTAGMDLSFGWLALHGLSGLPQPHRVNPTELLGLGGPPTAWGIRVENRRLYEYILTHGNTIGASNVGFSRHLWEQLGGFRKHLRVCWDYDFLLRSLGAGAAVGFIDANVGRYWMHDSNLHLQGDNCPREYLPLRETHLRRPTFPGVNVLAIRHSLATDYFDYGYGLSEAGRVWPACQAYLRAASLGVPPVRCVTAAVKAVIKSVTRRRSTA